MLILRPPPVAESSSRTGPGAAPALHLARVPGVNPSSGGGSRATGELELRWAALIRCWHWSGRPQHPADTFCPPTLRATLTHSLARRRAAWLTDWLASGLLVWSLLVWCGVVCCAVCCVLCAVLSRQFEEVQGCFRGKDAKRTASPR